MTTAPERIFVEGRIFRRGIAAEPVEGLAIAQGRVLASGTNNEMRALADRDTAIEGLDGGVVVPGFHDAHLHLAAGSLALAGLDLRECASAEAVAERVRSRAAELPQGDWIRGWGWDHSRWAGGGWPDKALLDRASPERPVWLSRIDGHVAWLSTLALAKVGIGEATTDPDGGEIVRDPETGAVTGVLLERARDLALEKLPAASDDERRTAVTEGLARLRRVGVTSIEDVEAPWAVEAYARLREEGRLSARVSAWLPMDLDRAQAEALRRRFPPDDPWISVSTLKVFLDGTLGSRSAAMLEPYADDPGNAGSLRVDPRQLAEETARADDAGWTVAMHAIGDRAVRLAIEVLENLPARPRPRPHRIEHVQVIAERDLPRLAACGAVASIQPVHFTEDRHWIESRLGPRRAAHAYPWRSLLRRGVPLAIGTDWPVAPLDPFRGLEAAKRGHSPFSDAPVGEHAEALTLAEAWEAYTLGPARAAGRERELGTLDPGRRADFVVLSDDPREVPLSSVRVRQTHIDGRRVD
jgi:predicted amidohydrolase YtcJ